MSIFGMLVKPQPTTHGNKPLLKKGVAVPGIDDDDIEYDDEEAAVAIRDESTLPIVARVVDTEDENRRLREQERMLRERDLFLRDRNKLRRKVGHAVVVDPITVADRDVENEYEQVAQGTANDGYLLENNG
jgi:hypothetical protein